MEYLSLILHKERFEVNKEKVASKSRYFESLLSANFNDCHKEEHIINYDISFLTLQNFIEWIHDDSCADLCSGCLKSSLEKFAHSDFTELLKLLELSVLFLTDELTCDIVDLIVLEWLLPEKVIDIWLLAEELNIKALRDICMSVCVNRFTELPIRSVVQLSKDQFTRLINNVNTINSSIDATVIEKWSEYNNLTLDVVHLQKKRKKQILHGSVVYRIGKKDYKNTTGKTAYVYIWNDSGQKLIDVPESVRHLVGMQFIAKGFSIYLVGGEAGFGTGKFNERILRYCLLSKKWYYHATMRSPRRHMIAAFLGNNLVLVGGVGKYRLQLKTVDILDLQTGEWRDGERIHETFVDVPPHCVVDKTLLFFTSTLYVYSFPNNGSQPHFFSVSINLPSSFALLMHESTLLLNDYDHSNATLLSKITVEPACEKESCSSYNVEHRLVTYDDSTDNEEIHEFRIKTTHVKLYDYIYKMTLIVPSNEDLCLHIHTEVNDDFKNIFIPKGYCCFDLIDPNSLYDTIGN